MQHQRIFSAINLTTESLRHVTELQRGLRADSPDGVGLRWVPPANIHVTLKFFGALHAEQLEAVNDAATKAAAGHTAFSLDIGELGVFPDRMKPRVLWLGLTEGAERLSGLRDSLEKSADDLGFERDERPFRAHLTLARIKDPGPGLEQWLADKGEGLPRCASSRVGEIVIYESITHPSGAEYRPLSHHPLGRRSKRS